MATYDDKKSLYLFKAASEGDLELFKLLEKDPQADLNYRPFNFRNAFQEAIAQHHMPLVKFMLSLPSRRFDLNLKETHDEFTPFYTACNYGTSEIVKLLLQDKRIDVRSHPEGHPRPFDLCLSNQRADLVELMIVSDRYHVLTSHLNPAPSAATVGYENMELLDQLNKNPEGLKKLLEKKLGFHKELNGGYLPLFCFSFTCFCIF